ncbi:MAG: hypothetical protein ACI39U_05675 [Candidatus Cryptobacteroides sp.]
MKSKAYINSGCRGHLRPSRFCLGLLGLLFICQPQVHACGPYWFYPADYFLLRIWNPSSGTDSPDKPDLLSEDWQKVLESPGLAPCEIEAYLSLARQCEIAREHYNSRWYYPSGEDGVSMTLEDIRDRSIAQARAGGPLSQRYALQAIRAMTSLRDYVRMYSFWSEMGKGIGEGVVGDMCLGYVARAYFELGYIDTALQIYRERGDLGSLLFCYKRMGKDVGRLDLVEDIVRYYPNHREIPKMMQDWFFWHTSHNCSCETYGARMGKQVVNLVDADRVCRISELALSNPVCENPALWHYLKALALDFSGRPKAASLEVQAASVAPGTEFIRESIRVLSIYLDAKNSAYNAAYLNRLLRDLQWLDAKIVGNLTEEIRKKTIKENWYLRSNTSYYYWNDMLKKILLGEVCPRMIDRGMPVLAIRLANMADNRLLNCVDAAQVWDNGHTAVLTMSQYRLSTVYFNDFDYSNGLFNLLDEKVGDVDIVAYVESLDKPRTALEMFLDERGYTEKSYFLDVAGTKCLRDMRYSDAVRILERVPSAYQYRLNTARYMNQDPFLNYRQVQGYQFPNYKLSFARQMEECERIMSGNSGPDEKGQAKIRYGVGLKSSFSSAWTLTGYSTGEAAGDCKSLNNICLGKVFIHEGLAMIRSREVKAQELLRLQLRLEVVRNYQGTSACRYVLRHCDEYRDWRGM